MGFLLNTVLRILHTVSDMTGNLHSIMMRFRFRIEKVQSFKNFHWDTNQSWASFGSCMQKRLDIFPPNGDQAGQKPGTIPSKKLDVKGT